MYARHLHTNTVENFFSILKRGIYGFISTSVSNHLHRYSAEFDFRQNNRSGLVSTITQRADLALLGIKGKRLTYAGTTEAEAIPF